MSGFRTKYGEAVSRVLAAYSPGMAQISAIETLIETACANAKAEVRDDFAQRVCEGFHKDPPSGLKCLSCYLAEMHFKEETVVQAEIDSSREMLPDDSVPETDPDSED